MKAFKIISFLFLWGLLLAACGPVATPTAAPSAPPAPTSIPSQSSTEPPTTPTAASTALSSTPSVEDQFAQIDSILKQSIQGSIAYNKPQSMMLAETTTIELLLNPSLSPEELSTQVSSPGVVASASVQVTPRMKAILYSDDAQAFSIQPEQDNPEQLVSGTETTRWA